MADGDEQPGGEIANLSGKGKTKLNAIVTMNNVSDESQSFSTVSWSDPLFHDYSSHLPPIEGPEPIRWLYKRDENYQSRKPNVTNTILAN